MNVAFSNLVRYLALILTAFSTGYMFAMNSPNTTTGFIFVLSEFLFFAAVDYKRHLMPDENIEQIR